LPFRTGFGRGDPLHDPWLFESHRLVASDETDCVLWISAYRGEAPAWLSPRTTIALTGHDARFASPPRIHIAVGRPGRDHDCAQYCSSTGTLAAVAAAEPSGAISVADAITRIAAALPDGAMSRC
jgi:formylmethanofuran dehydrogenase subunit B